MGSHIVALARLRMVEQDCVGPSFVSGPILSRGRLRTSPFSFFSLIPSMREDRVRLQMSAPTMPASISALRQTVEVGEEWGSR